MSARNDGFNQDRAVAMSFNRAARKHAHEALKATLARFDTECQDWIDKLQEELAEELARSGEVEEANESEVDDSEWMPDAVNFSRCVLLNTNQPLPAKKLCALNGLYAAEGNALNHAHQSAILSMSHQEEHPAEVALTGPELIERFQAIHQRVTR